MKKVINGRTYNTDTATLVCHVLRGCWGDLDYLRADLYRTRDGRWFLAGSGGARTVFGVEGAGGWLRGSEGIRPLTDAQAEHYQQCAA